MNYKEIYIFFYFICVYFLLKKIKGFNIVFIYIKVYKYEMIVLVYN